MKERLNKIANDLYETDYDGLSAWGKEAVLRIVDSAELSTKVEASFNAQVKPILDKLSKRIDEMYDILRSMEEDANYNDRPAEFSQKGASQRNSDLLP